MQLYEYTTLLKESYQEAALYSLGAIAILAFIHFDTGPTNECAEAVAAEGLPPDTPCRSVYVPAKVVDGVLVEGHFELVPVTEP